jgi:hypothetical protein
MKKLLVNLSMLSLLAFLLVPLVGCKHEENTEVEEPPAASTEAAPAAMGTEPMATGSAMGTEAAPMGTDSGAMGAPAMGTQGTEPPPAK